MDEKIERIKKFSRGRSKKKLDGKYRRKRGTSEDGRYPSRNGKFIGCSRCRPSLAIRTTNRVDITRILKEMVRGNIKPCEII